MAAVVGARHTPLAVSCHPPASRRRCGRDLGTRGVTSVTLVGNSAVLGDGVEPLTPCPPLRRHSTPEPAAQHQHTDTFDSLRLHAIRNMFRLTSRRYWDELKRDVKPIYTAVNATVARAAFDDLAEKWGGPLTPASVRACRQAVRRGAIRAQRASDRSDG